MKVFSASSVVALVSVALLGVARPANPSAVQAAPSATAQAIFAGGCFWSMEHVFDDIPGVTSVVVGYTGSSFKNPSYEQVEMGVTGHVEAVRVTFDPAKVTYDALLQAYWHNTDPTDGAGQFCDTGSQYRPMIFYGDEVQHEHADASKRALEASGRLKRVLTKVAPATAFWPAEAYHQHFYKTHAAAYERYRIGCGRDARLKQLWGKQGT